MEEETTYRYPWARSLFLIVVYVALLLFLWYLPWEGPRLFFQKLMMGFVYGLAALLLIGVTLLVILFIAPPVPQHLLEDELERFDEAEWEDWEEGAGYVEVLGAHAIAVPALLDPVRSELVWEVLDTLALRSVEAIATISVDEETGIIAVTEEDDKERSARLLKDIKRALESANLRVRKPKV